MVVALIVDFMALSVGLLSAGLLPVGESRPLLYAA
jgi:hypothetical protein